MLQRDAGLKDGRLKSRVHLRRGLVQSDTRAAAIFRDEFDPCRLQDRSEMVYRRLFKLFPPLKPNQGIGGQVRTFCKLSNSPSQRCSSHSILNK